MTTGLSMYIFFFSSRRRHTRLQGDWSSDVCSSDLNKMLSHKAIIFLVSDFLGENIERPLKLLAQRHDVVAVTVEDPSERLLPDIGGSEKGRVGEEGRFRGGRGYLKKKNINHAKIKR